LAQARQCGSCSLCCKVLGIAALEKPVGAWCTHCVQGRGCAIYDDRPAECRGFVCGWLRDERLGDEWYPKRSKIVLTYEQDRFVAHVDASTPRAWREEPYATALKKMMLANLPLGKPVYVAIGRHQILLLPDREEDLGILGEQDEVEVAAVSRPTGLEYRVAIHRGAKGAKR
jgi:hypothetical protein